VGSITLCTDTSIKKRTEGHTNRGKKGQIKLKGETQTQEDFEHVIFRTEGELLAMITKDRHVGHLTQWEISIVWERKWYTISE
jgi:hypothetical protein